MSPSRAEFSIRSWTRRVDPLGAAPAEDRDLVEREIALLEDPVADRVVDVVVDVGDPVDDADDLALERLRLLLAPVGEDAVAHLVGEVQPLGDPERLLVVAEMAAMVRGELRVERRLARVPERRVARVVPEPDRLDEILVQAQGARHDPGDPGRLEGVRHPRAVVVAGRVDEDLRLALSAAGTASNGRSGRGRAGTGCGRPTPARGGAGRGSRTSGSPSGESHSCSVWRIRSSNEGVRISLCWGIWSAYPRRPVYPARPLQETAVYATGSGAGADGTRSTFSLVDSAGTSNTVRWISVSRYSSATASGRPAGVASPLEGGGDAAPPFMGGGAGLERAESSRGLGART